jgi:tetratricopeptide (TPR) repeat protein
VLPTWEKLVAICAGLGAIIGVLTYFEITPKNFFLLFRKHVAPPAAPSVVPTQEPAPLRIGLRPGRDVIGRDAEMATLAAALLTGGKVVLAGQGGLGKSTLARHYAEVRGAQYHGIVWTRAATRAEVIGGLMAVGGALGMVVPAVPQLADAQAVLARMVETGKRWLVIYDNVDNFADIKDLIPQKADLIVTTRGGEGWPGFALQKPGALAFDRDDAVAVLVLQAAAGRQGDAAAARDLAEALGGLPLALVVAGALIKATGEGYAVYAGRLAEVLAHVPANEDYPTSVIGAVTLSYDVLGADAKVIADLCAWWAADGLVPGLLTDAPLGEWWTEQCGDVPDGVQSLAADPARVRAGFVELTARSLLSKEVDGWAMHRMTALPLRVMQAGRGEMAVAAAALLNAVYPEGEKSPAFSPQWPICARLTPHVQAIWATGAAPKTAAMGTLLNQSAVYLDQIADYPGGAEMAAAALSLAEALLPETDRKVAVALANHGLALMRLGDLDGAASQLERAVALDEVSQPVSEDMADHCDMLGGVLMRQARAGKPEVLALAARRAQKALALRRHLLGRGEALAQSLNNMGAVRNLQDRAAAASRLYAASLRINRAVLPPGDARLGYGLMNTGASRLRGGQADLAEPLLREALELRQQVYAGQPQHPEARGAARWLILCLLQRAAAGENRGLREMEARGLCERYGFEFDEMKVEAMRYPYVPVAG